MDKQLLKKRFDTGGKFQKEQEYIFRKILAKKAMRILEVGCGKGYFSYIAAKVNNNRSLYGTDVYKDFQIEEIKKYSKCVEYKDLKKNILPFKDNSFDAVFSMDVIEHVKNDSLFIREQIRVCNKKGQILIGTPNYYRLTNLPLIFIGKLKYPRDMGGDTYGRCIHLREYKKNELLKIIMPYEKKKIITNVKIFPCWFGVMAINIGIDKLPKMLEKYCQFWFVSFTKV